MCGKMRPRRRRLGQIPLHDFPWFLQFQQYLELSRLSNAEVGTGKQKSTDELVRQVVKRGFVGLVYTYTLH